MLECRVQRWIWPDKTAEPLVPDERLTELEIALAHQERLCEELSDMVRAQSDRLDRLERALATLVRRLDEADSGPEAPPASVRPPHW